MGHLAFVSQQKSPARSRAAAECAEIIFSVRAGCELFVAIKEVGFLNFYEASISLSYSPISPKSIVA